ncbi:MAG: hypothetical protein K2Y01_10550 [Rhabdochlamydiaceae bacterium]|nr:hypothetical protein [Rhabdochlamydiaceae bacterium]
MSHEKGKEESEDPKPLNFDHDDLKESLTPEDGRGDNENNQYYEEEEALSPEEVKKRKEEGTF